MKFLPVVTVLFVASAVYGQAEPPADEAHVAATALKILNDWHGGALEDPERSLHLVCWTPSDRDFPADYRARLTRIMRHIQGFYLREMERLGLGARTFNLNFDNDQMLVLHTVTGTHTTDHYAGHSGAEIRRECLPVLNQAGIDADRETILILCHLATWDESTLRFTHKSPYYAGGSYRSGTAWQLDSPELDSQNLTLRMPIIQDGQYGRISLGKHNSIFIGGIAHELGHALGLPHCRARPDEAVRGTALMGSGNRTYGEELRSEGRGSFLTLAHGLRLMSHPQFSASTKGFDQPTRVDIADLAITAVGKSIQVSGTVQGTPPIYAVVAYFDPEGHGDYDATTACAIPATDGRFVLKCDALPPGRPGELRLFPLHANGSAAGQMSRTRFRSSYQMTADGTPDLDTFQTKQQLNPIISALNSDQRPEAEELAKTLESPQVRAIAMRLVQPHHPTTSPAEYEGDSREIALTQFQPESVKVGWGRPAFDRVPEQTLILESGGRIYETGIYAHAPARHSYRIGGQWSSFRGTVGLAAGHHGTVQFEVKGDGKTLWSSKTVRAESTVNFQVRIDGVQQLELLTDPTTDGPGSDWGLWLEPILTR